ncbi:formimidoylglutamase [Alkalimonas delamerensis]|uniref:Formimidoylglutamase n=1 Tax=Alkalimonas delamerensis TaxID=265981 RepID=A0ABT9GLR4_9GAMM|nr:formimidoylglutamase [Alkalimonas delamerensis]MDP4527606.1 formimidoylglutamase [Alkalimonas delamerensis]
MALRIYTAAELAAWSSTRPNEQRLAQQLLLPDPSLPLHQTLQQARAQGARFAILGIPEDIGPRGNLGKGGAELGWQAFLKVWLNLQANQFSEAFGPVLLAGEVDCQDLLQQSQALDPQQPEQLSQLRQLCAALDQRVEDAVAPLFAAGFDLLVIGGGHNNAYPLIKALAQQSGQPVSCANLDPHADFRPQEGRHSGNGFSYAKAEQLLDKYFVLGLHELKNNQASLDAMRQAEVEWISLQALSPREELSWPEALDRCVDFVANSEGAIGIELDTDSIELMPVSAFTSSGVTVQAAERYIYQLAQLPRCRYLHLAEAAPSRHPAGVEAGLAHSGQVLSSLCYAFLQARAKLEAQTIAATV